MITSRFADHAGTRIHYLDSGGDDEGAPIVFVPGMTDIAEDYREVMPAFGRRTVVIELRGHGRSAAPSDGYHRNALVGDVGAVIDAITAGPVHLVTFSRGTTYAVGWAVEHLDRVRSLSIGDYVPEERVVTEAESDGVLDGRWRGTPVHTRLDRTAATATFRAAREHSFWEALAQNGIPLLAVRALKSPLITGADWARYGRLFPDARLVEFEASPHDIFRPDRDRYPRLVCEHADHVDGPRGH